LRLDLLPRAEERFEQAIALDPKFALAHCEYEFHILFLAIVGVLPANQALPRARSLTQKALELDPSLAEGHAMMGAMASLECDWKEAEKCFRVAMARDPVPAFVRPHYGMGFLLRTGRPAEAVQQLELALREDPLNFLLLANRAYCLAADGRDDESAGAYRDVLELNQSAFSQLGLASYHASRGEFDQALAAGEKAHALAPQYPDALGLLAGLLKRSGDARRAEELLEKLQPADAYGVPRGLATYHWVLREFDAEADWIEKAIDQRDPYGAAHLRTWYGRELRSTPHWARLMRKLNLPES
jgi:Tfp pilus assembly protein PilF